MNKVLNFIENHNWKVAKTYKNYPHSYVFKGALTNDDDVKSFEYFVLYIRKYGFTGIFFKTSYVYLYINGYYYWTMGNPLEETTIINRASDKDYEIKEFNNKKYFYRRKDV